MSNVTYNIQPKTKNMAYERIRAHDRGAGLFKIEILNISKNLTTLFMGPW